MSQQQGNGQFRSPTVDGTTIPPKRMPYLFLSGRLVEGASIPMGTLYAILRIIAQTSPTLIKPTTMVTVTATSATTVQAVPTIVSLIRIRTASAMCATTTTSKHPIQSSPT